MSTEPDPWTDEPAEQEVPEQTPPPGIIRAAGIVWMAVGVLFVFSGLAYTILAPIVPGLPANGTEQFLLWLGIVIGVGLFLAGMNALFGRAKDLLIVSILSLFLAVLNLILGIGALFLLSGSAAGIVGAVSILIGVGCLVPALLALFGRAEYDEWRMAKLAQEQPEGEEDEMAATDEEQWQHEQGEENQEAPLDEQAMDEHPPEHGPGGKP